MSVHHQEPSTVCTAIGIGHTGYGDCPKHVETYSKNKYKKLVLLVGFVIRIISNVLMAI